MTTKTQDLMTREVVTAGLDEKLEQVRQRMVERSVSALPVVDGASELVGIVTSTDLLRVNDPEATVAEVMSEHVYTVPPSADVHIPARVMRNHGIHHVVVTTGKSIDGVLASYDLLQLVEKHRYSAKAMPAAATPHADEENVTEQGARLNALLGHLTRRTAGVDRARRRGDGALSPDFQEQVVVRENDEVLDALSREGHNQIELIGEALERLDSGQYGVCKACENPIGDARLDALPYAVLCIECARGQG